MSEREEVKRYDHGDDGWAMVPDPHGNYVLYRDHAEALTTAERERDEARRECEEQARLNGMGGEREAKLLARLQTAEHERAEWENAAGVYEAGMVRAERERDEARRERDAIRKQYAMSLEEQVELVRQREETSSQLWDCMNERDGWKHRAERAERVVEQFFDELGTISGEPCGSRTAAALARLYGAVRALDAAEGTP